MPSIMVICQYFSCRDEGLIDPWMKGHTIGVNDPNVFRKEIDEMHGGGTVIIVTTHPGDGTWIAEALGGTVNQKAEAHMGLDRATKRLESIESQESMKGTPEHKDAVNFVQDMTKATDKSSHRVADSFVESLANLKAPRSDAGAGLGEEEQFNGADEVEGKDGASSGYNEESDEEPQDDHAAVGCFHRPAPTPAKCGPTPGECDDLIVLSPSRHIVLSPSSTNTGNSIDRSLMPPPPNRAPSTTSDETVANVEATASNAANRHGAAAPAGSLMPPPPNRAPSSAPGLVSDCPSSGETTSDETEANVEATASYAANRHGAAAPARFASASKSFDTDSELEEATETANQGISAPKSTEESKGPGSSVLEVEKVGEGNKITFVKNPPATTIKNAPKSKSANENPPPAHTPTSSRNLKSTNESKGRGSSVLEIEMADKENNIVPYNKSKMDKRIGLIVRTDPSAMPDGLAEEPLEVQRRPFIASDSGCKSDDAKAEVPSSEPNYPVGTKVAKWFEDKGLNMQRLFHGEVVSFNWPLYKVLYDDQDVEDLTEEELASVLVKNEENEERPSKKQKLAQAWEHTFRPNFGQGFLLGEEMPDKELPDFSSYFEIVGKRIAVAWKYNATEMFPEDELIWCKGYVGRVIAYHRQKSSPTRGKSRSKLLRMDVEVHFDGVRHHEAPSTGRFVLKPVNWFPHKHIPPMEDVASITGNERKWMFLAPAHGG